MPDTAPLVSVQIVVHNGRRFIRHCLDAVRAQTYPNLQVVALDNASDDTTADIIASDYPEFQLIRGDRNLGMWPGQELLLGRTQGPYILALSVDVILDPQFVVNAVAACQQDGTIAAVQGKMYQYDIVRLEREPAAALHRDTIDTCGFAMTRARKVLNIGHGQPDGPRYTWMHDIFGVEGAAPFFRRSALQECRMDGWIWDPDYFWYSDDFDFAWRMTLFGHRQVFVPSAVAWHDRSTTKGSAQVPVIGQLRRLASRRSIPLSKRRLGWSNDRFTIVKNDYIINVLRDLPYILAREIAVLGYTVLFEPAVLLELGRFFRLLPRMLRRRRLVMQQAITAPAAMHQWFT